MRFFTVFLLLLALASCASKNITLGTNSVRSPKMQELLSQSSLSIQASNIFMEVDGRSLLDFYKVEHCMKCIYFITIEYHQPEVVEGIFGNSTWPLSILTFNLYPFKQKIKSSATITVDRLGSTIGSKEMEQIFEIQYPFGIPSAVPDSEKVPEIEAVLLSIVGQIN